MALNLVRTGTALGAGVASGALSSSKVAPLVLGTTSISWGLVAEGVAVLIGAGMQFISPFTMPNVADGLVDGGVALLSARGAKYAMEQMGTPTTPYARGQLATRVASPYAARPAMGGSSDSGPRKTLT